MSTQLDITPDIDLAPWKDAKGAKHGIVERVGLLRNGTSSGRAAVEILIRLDDGSLVLAETTLRLARTAAAGIVASAVFSEEPMDD